MFGRPVIFVSAVSKELRGTRDLVAKTLTGLGYEPKWEDIAPTETGDLRGILRRWVDDSAAVIQLVGKCYGCEPPAPDPEFGRSSYTQYEALYARQQGKKVWVLLLTPEHPTEAVADEPAELHTLQQAYRQRIQSDGHLYHASANLDQTEKIVLKLRDDLAPLRRGWKQWAALVLALLVLTVLGIWLVKKDTAKVPQIVAGQTALAGQLSQVQDALSRIQQKTDPQRDPIIQWPQERLEAELAQQMRIEVRDLRAILAAGKTSLDALLQGQALLASGKTMEAGEKFDVVIDQEKGPMQRLRQAYEGKAQIAFDAVRYVEALEFREKAAALVNKSTDPIGWADAQGWVTSIDLHLARYAHAEPLMKEVVRLREEHLGPEHPHLATALNELEQLYNATNRLAEAEPLMVRVVQILENKGREPLPNFAAALNNLATLYYSTNRLAEAEPLMERALKIDEKSYGPEHPEVAIDLNNLAQLYKHTNRLVEAEPLLERALKIDEKSYGPEHPNVAIRLNNLAQLYQATKRLAEAEPLLERALKIDEKSFGPEHPNVATRLNNLAQLYKHTNRLAEAEPLMKRVTSIFEKSLGREHPNVATSLNNLAGLYQATKRLAEAEPLLERALKIDEKSYGTEHPDVATDLNSLATLYYSTNRLAEAEQRLRRAVVIVLKSTRSAGHVVANLENFVANYKVLLSEMAVPEEEVSQRLAAAGQEAGFTQAEMKALLAPILGPFDVTVTEVVPEGQGPGLEIRVGDVVRRYNGQEINRLVDLVNLTGEVPGAAIPLEIRRGGETLHLTAKPGRLGLRLEDRPKTGGK